MSDAAKRRQKRWGEEGRNPPGGCDCSSCSNERGWHSGDGGRGSCDEAEDGSGDDVGFFSSLQESVVQLDSLLASFDICGRR